METSQLVTHISPDEVDSKVGRAGAGRHRRSRGAFAPVSTTPGRHRGPRRPVRTAVDSQGRRRKQPEISAVALGLIATPTALSANATTMTLPDIARDIGVSVSTTTWIATVFGLAMAVSTPLAAAVLRRRGVRTAVLACAALVICGTATVAVSEALPGLLIGRAAQALGGSGFVTAAITLAGTPRRMSVVSAGSGMFGALGPLSGSLLTDNLSWHIALSLSAIALLAVPYVVLRAPAPRQQETETPFDTVGAILAVALICTLVLLARFPVPALIAAAVISGALTLWIRREPNGFIPTAVLRSPVFLTAAGIVCALSTGYFALLYTTPRLLENSTSWDSVTIGTGSLVALLTGSVVSFGVTTQVHRVNRSFLLSVLVSLGILAPLTAAVATTPGMMLAAAGAAVFVATAAQATLAVTAGGGVPEAQRTTALGLFTLCYQLGGAFGPATAAVLLE